jgi:hypothetical protein
MREWVATSKSKTSKSINDLDIVIILQISFFGQIIKSQNVTTHHQNDLFYNLNDMTTNTTIAIATYFKII